MERRNIKIFITLLTALLVIGVTFFANAQSDIFILGNQAFRKNNFKEALDYYNKIEMMDKGGYGLYINMAKSYASLKNDPMSILYYEKALKLKPFNSEATRELTAIMKRNPQLDTSEKPNFIIALWQRLSGLFMPDMWAVLSLLLIFIFGIFYYFKEKSIFIIKNIRPIALVFCALFLVFIAASSYRKNVVFGSKYAIILSGESGLKAGPDDVSPALSTLQSGSKVETLDLLGGWTQVMTLNGDIGWVKTQHMSYI